MKILITGSGGQLGQEWVDFCTKKNISFQSFSSRELDITDKDSVSRAIKNYKPDVFINCAAYTKVDAAEDNKDLALQVNGEAVKIIAQICAENRIKLVHYSTDYVFSGEKEDSKIYSEGYSEEHEINPLNVYGLSKRKGEEALLESDCEYLLIRVSWLCGRFGNNFVKTMLKLAKSRKELSVVNDQFGSPTFADQVVEQSFKLLEKNEDGVFHLSSKGIATWYDFSKEIFAQKKLSVKVIPVTSEEFPTKAKRPAFSKLSTQKISNISGVEMIHWEEGLARLLKQL
ncbi:MAG: dTDP-4-dehydrorhamnose reductase [Balneola sp.]